MKRVISNTLTIDTDIENVISSCLPYILEISIASDYAITASEEPTVSVVDDIFEYPEYLEYFADLIREELSNKFNIAVADIKINESHNSVYLPAVQRVDNSLIKLKAEIGYILRVSNHPQRIPYSEEAQKSREASKQILRTFINRLFNATHQSQLHTQFPEIDYSITVLVSQHDSKNFKTLNLTDAASYIAEDMYHYIQRESASLLQ